MLKKQKIHIYEINYSPQGIVLRFFTIFFACHQGAHAYRTQFHVYDIFMGIAWWCASPTLILHATRTVFLLVCICKHFLQLPLFCTCIYRTIPLFSDYAASALSENRIIPDLHAVFVCHEKGSLPKTTKYMTIISRLFLHNRGLQYTVNACFRIPPV